MDREPTDAFAVIGPEPADPMDQAVDRKRPAVRGYGGAQADERVSPRAPLPVPRPTASDRHLDLDHRLEPVDVRSIEEADLDHAHGRPRIAPRSSREPPDVAPSGPTRSRADLDLPRWTRQATRALRSPPQRSTNFSGRSG